MREIKYNEVYKLRECLEELSNYHNKVAVNFKGIYPRRSCDETLEMFYDSLYKGNSEIAVEENGSAIIGFCKINIEGNSGKLDYLFVSEKYRGNNYGREFIKWAMDKFNKSNVNEIEVKVIHGNDSIYFYEKFGFKMQAHILMLK